jgi:hypothetical protein
MFMQSDVHERNIVLDPTGRLYPVGFGAVGLPPKSFVVYTVMAPHDPFAGGVASCLPSWKSSNLAAVDRAKGILVVAANPTLGTTAQMIDQRISN